MPVHHIDLRKREPEPEVSRYSINDYANQVSMAFQGQRYLLSGGSSGWTKTEDIEHSFTSYISSLYKSNGIVFAIILARMLLFTEARFCWFEINDNGEDGRPKGRKGLEVLERPWPNCGTGELLARMEQDVSLGGNFYAVREGSRLRRLRPDWVTIVLTAPPAESTYSDVAGYWYHPGRSYTNAGEPSPGDEVYLPDECAHWSPIPDPDAQYRGMSWLSPAVREVMADKAASEHKLSFFTNGSTLGAIISAKESLTNNQYKEWKANFEGIHSGAGNAYKSVFLASPVDVSILTANMQQLDFKVVQGAGETRLCALGGVPPIIVGLSEGLASATYSNYGMARRKFGDHWAHPQWKSASQALANLVDPPPDDVRLGVNVKGIAFLREDAKEAAEILQIKASLMSTLIMAGYTPDSAAVYAETGDPNDLEHSGLTSVQLVPPSTVEGSPEDVAAEEEYDVLLDEIRAQFDDEDEISRRRYGTGPGERVGAGNVGGGRFKKLSDEVIALLHRFIDEGGDDPLDDESWTQARLKKAAEQLGLTEPRKRYTKAQLKVALLKHARGDKPDAAPKAPAKKDTPRAPAKKAAPTTEAVAERLLEIGKTGTKEDADDYLDGLGLSADQMRQLARDLDVPSPAGASKRQARDDIVLVRVSGRLRTRSVREGTKTYGYGGQPDTPDPESAARQRQADIDSAVVEEVGEAAAETPPSKPTIDEVGARLYGDIRTEDQAVELLAGLNVPELKSLADRLNVAVPPSVKTKPKMQLHIAQEVIGHRRRTEGFAFYGNPDAPTPDPLSSLRTLDPEAARDALALATTREEGRAVLEGMNVAQLKAVARLLSIDDTRRNKVQLRDAIVNGTVGVRVDSEAIIRPDLGARRRREEAAADPLADVRDMSADDARDALDLRKVDDLKALIRQANERDGVKLAVSGRKRDLVDRLVGHLHPEAGSARHIADSAVLSNPDNLGGRVEPVMTQAERDARLREANQRIDETIDSIDFGAMSSLSTGNRPGKKVSLKGVPDGFEVRLIGKDVGGDEIFDVYAGETRIGTVRKYEKVTVETDSQGLGVGGRRRQQFDFTPERGGRASTFQNWPDLLYAQPTPQPVGHLHPGGGEGAEAEAVMDEPPSAVVPGGGDPDALTPGELTAIGKLSTAGKISDGGWVRVGDMAAADRASLESLVSKGFVQKHIAAGGVVMFRIDPRPGSARGAAGSSGALVGDVVSPDRRPEPRLSLTKVNRGAIIEGYRNDDGTFGNVPEDGTVDPSRVVRVVVQRQDPVDENGQPVRGVFLQTHRRIIGHDAATGRRIESEPVAGGSYWSWVMNPDTDTSADIEGELVEPRQPIDAPRADLSVSRDERIRQLMATGMTRKQATEQIRQENASRSTEPDEDDIERADYDDHPGEPDDEMRARAQACLDDCDEDAEEPDDADYDMYRAAGADTNLGGERLHYWWTKGPGLARWVNSPHPWTALYTQLREHVGAARAKRMASAWFHEVFGIWSGERKGSNPVGPG